MTTQILEFAYSTGQTLTAKIFAIGSDTVVQTASSVSEYTNRKGIYRATFADVASGNYMLVYFLDGLGAGYEFFKLINADRVFQIFDYENQTLSSNFLVPLTIKTGTGTVVPYCLVTVTTSEDSESSQIVDSQNCNRYGKIEFNLSPGTYYVWRSKAGYSFEDPITVVVGEDGEITV